MIRIKVELCKGGSTKKKDRRLLGIMLIANDGSGSKGIGNYECVIKTEYGVRKGKLSEFNRRTQSVWTLVGSFLKLFGHTKHSPSLMEEIK